MEKEICPYCHKPVYSSVFENDWECPNCEAVVTGIENNY